MPRTSGSMYVMLKEFDQRRGPDLTADAIAADLVERCRREVRGADRHRLRRAADRRARDYRRLQADRRGSRQSWAWRSSSGSATRSSAGRARRRGSRALQQLAGEHALAVSGHRPHQVPGPGRPGQRRFQHLQVYLGSYYVNNFNEFGRTWQVNIQADATASATRCDEIRELQVRNNQGQMVRLGTLLDVRDTQRAGARARATICTRPPRSPATPRRAPAPARRSTLMQRIADQEMPRSMASDWTELAYLQLQAGNTAICVLRAWPWRSSSSSWPPSTKAGRCRWPSSSWCRCACSARSAASRLANLEVSLFTQIGFVVLVGLASKNAILIVEFARQRQEEGADGREATLARGPAAAAADPDDLLRLHPRRRAAGRGRGGRGRDAAFAGPGRVQRACSA